MQAPHTVSWFEFLLDPDLITNHLHKECPQPNAVDLLSQFVSLSEDSAIGQSDASSPDIAALPGDGLKLTRKQYALKVLALKVGTHLKWNFDVIDRCLSIPKQIILLKDLFAICFGKVVPIPLPKDFKVEIGLEGNECAAHFTMALYHRWVLRRITKAPSTIKQPMHGPTIASNLRLQLSVDYLHELCKSSDSFYSLTMDTFVIRNHANPDLYACHKNFNTMVKITPAELRAQISYDLVRWYQYTMQPMLAFSTGRECMDSFNILKAELAKNSESINSCSFLTLTESSLDAVLLMCGIKPLSATFESRLAFSEVAKFKAFGTILAADNCADELPCELRELALNKLEGKVIQNTVNHSSISDMDAAALNVIKRVIKDGDKRYADYFENYGQRSGFLRSLGNAIANSLPHCTEDAKQRLKVLITECILKHGVNNQEFVKQVRTFNLLEEQEWRQLEPHYTKVELEVPALLAQNNWRCNTKSQFISITGQLITCMDAYQLKTILVQLRATFPTRPIWTVNPSWEMSTQLRTLVMALQSGFLQDFAYVILGKAGEMTAKKNFNIACTMLSVLLSEFQRQDSTSIPQIHILDTLVNWEILFIQIIQCLEQWSQKTSHPQDLGTRCKQCLSALRNRNNVTPRIEIIECSTVMLLNLTDCKALVSLKPDKRLQQLELPIAVAQSFLEIENKTFKKKSCHATWNIVLSMFWNASKQRRSGRAGNNPNLTVETDLKPFFKRVRHATLFDLSISLLAKINNILYNDTNNELSGEYMRLWPDFISNPINYNKQRVNEILHWIIGEALKFYPQNLSWLKMQGDLKLAMDKSETAMRCYVDLLVTATDNFSTILPQSIINDHLIQKMIRCSTNLGYHMQAIVLCQFLEDINYSICFKNLSERSSNIADPIEAHYDCIWDPLLCEFIINLHAERREFSRKLEAISKMTHPELNPNNDEEIKHEAVEVRKIRFLRALAKQYLR